jgi:hypothetical protein
VGIFDKKSDEGKKKKRKQKLQCMSTMDMLDDYLAEIQS